MSERRPGDWQIGSFPSKTTVWQMLTGAEPVALYTAIGAWLLAQTTAKHPSSEPAAERAPAQLADPSIGSGAAGSSLIEFEEGRQTVRGAVGGGGAQTHLLAAATHSEQLALGQVEVEVRSDEIPQFTPLITGLAAAEVRLSDMVITSDASHCQRRFATILHQRSAQFCFSVKHNQPGVHIALDAQPWAQTPIEHRSVERGHTRNATRTV